MRDEVPTPSQQEVLFGPLPDDPDQRTIEERFREFHTRNPHVYRLLVHYAREALAVGRRRIGIRMLWERMRWDLYMQVDRGDAYKLNDHYTSRYARLIMANEADLSEAFEVRTLRAK